MTLRRGLRWAALLLATGALSANGVVYAHAWRFTHFVPAGTRTANPETLSRAERIAVLLRGVEVPRPTLRRAPDAALHAEEVQVGPIATWVIPRVETDRPADALGARPGDTVLLFHGYGGSRSDLLPEATSFHERGLTAVLVDFPGSGGSDGDVTTLGWHEADVVRDIAARFRPAPGGRLVLYGKSMGAAAILRAVGVLGVSADRLVLENPFDRLVTTVGHRFEAMGLPAFPGAELLVFWGGVQHGFDGFAHDPVDYARGVTVPTLLMVGEGDDRAHPAEVAAIEAALAGPRYPMVVFPGAGHAGLWGADRARWEHEVEGALYAIEAPSREPAEVERDPDACRDAGALLARRAALPLATLAARWGDGADPPVRHEGADLTVQTRVLASVSPTPAERILLVECVLADAEAGGRQAGSAQHLLGVGADGLLWSEEVGLQVCCGVEWWSEARLTWAPDFPAGVGSVRLRGTIDGSGDQEGYGGTASRWATPSAGIAGPAEGRAAPPLSPSAGMGVPCAYHRAMPMGAFALEDGASDVGPERARVRTTVAVEGDALVLTERWTPAEAGRAESWRRSVAWDRAAGRFVAPCPAGLPPGAWPDEPAP
ncbi:MAG: alpha/beta hydrolase [Pseudomonadota bacterium]|nr:alpha/beta hydrolase [Pseudomonadota bacterium]